MKTMALGRPSKFTEEARRKILWALRLGNYRIAAAEYAGVADRTLCTWLAKGRDEEEGLYADFYRDVLEAERAAEVRALGVIQQAAQRDWKAAAWFLERKFPDRYCTRAAIFIAKRLALRDEPEWDTMTEKQLEVEMLRAVQTATKDISREKLLAAIDGKDIEPRVIDVDGNSENGSGQ